MDETPIIPEDVTPEPVAPLAGPVVANETLESFSRLKPIVQSIFELIANEKAPTGIISPEDDDTFHKLAEQVIILMRDGNALYTEKETVFQLVLQPFDKVRGIVLDSLNRSANKAMDKKMGKPFGEVTLKDLDAILLETSEKVA